MQDVRTQIGKILSLLPEYSAPVVENGADLNRAVPALNEACSADALIEAVFDADSYVECGKSFSPEVRCILGAHGAGLPSRAVVFDSEAGVFLKRE